MIEFTEGDMFANPADIRVNTVNCVGVMGAGIALAFKKRNPEMYKEYKAACTRGDIKPGALTEWRELGGDWIINFPTKRHWRNPSRYEDVEAGLDALRDYLEPLGPLTVALPALGCGHGGLDWGDVSKLISKKLEGLQAHILVYAPSDSRKAGRNSNEQTSDEEIQEVERMGFRVLNYGEQTTFVAGSEKIANAEKWLAILPSRQPSDRELAALESVAASIASAPNHLAVALIYQSKVSELIMGIFARFGVNVVAIAPFGVATRPSLIKAAKDSRAVISLAPPNKKWSHSLLAEAFLQLRKKASAVLISDPDPHWVTKRSSDWQDLPTNFVRYEEMAHETLASLIRMGSKPVGRGSVETLFSEQVPGVMTENDQHASLGDLELEMTDFPLEVREMIASLLIHSSPKKWAMTIKMSDPVIAAEIEEKINRLGGSKKRVSAH